jgi:hypothetical protein
MIWKSLMTQANPDIEFIPGFINDGNGAPTGGIIENNTAYLLNTHEASSGDFISLNNPTGELIAVNPPGSWNQVVIEDPNVAMIYAAMNIWKWGTPVFTNINSRDNNYQNVVAGYEGIMPEVGVIQCVTLSAVGGPPHLACGWNTDGSDFLEQASQCDVVIESIVLSTYNSPLLCTSCSGFSYKPEHNVTPNTYSQLHENANNFSSNVFGLKFNWVLADPPENENSVQTMATFLEASRVIAQKAVRRTVEISEK